jgi:hypothetical protein|tara:strand:+ start:198 stop:524 length:327 start_codon:yes stop_codon:yes gene_type:complete
MSAVSELFFGKVVDNKSTIFVLTISGAPDCYFDTRSDAIDHMRERALQMCLMHPFGIEIFPISHSIVRHHSDEQIDIVRRLSNVLISYDQVVCSFKVTEVTKKILCNK